MKLTLAAGVVAVVVLAAGCSEDPEPKFEEPSETPTASSQSSDPSQPPSPEAELGPLATVSAWTEARNDALVAGDTSAARELSATDCETCFDYLEPIEAVYESGGRFETAGSKIIGSNVRSESSGMATVDVGVEFAAGRTIPAAGAAPVDYEAERELLSFRLVRTGSHWLVQQIVVVR